MYVARKPLSIGPRAYAAGDEIDGDTQRELHRKTPGRLLQLVSNGYVEHLTDEGALERRLSVLEELVAELSSRVNVLEARRGPGRPRKEESE